MVNVMEYSKEQRKKEVLSWESCDPCMLPSSSFMSWNVTIWMHWL